MSMDDERFYTEICQECGGFRMKCDLYGHIPKNDLPYEESGSTNELARDFLLAWEDDRDTLMWNTRKDSTEAAVREAASKLRERLRSEGWYKDE
jgi:hypothetical protein